MSKLKTSIMPSEDRKPDKRFLKLPDNHLLFNPARGPVSLVLGATGSGKTSWLWSYLNDWTPNLYDEVIIFSGTVDSNDTWEKLKQRNVIVLNDYDDSAFWDYYKDLEKEQKDRRKGGLRELRVCVVFDDFICEGISKMGKPTALDKLVLTSRHLYASVFILSQKYKGFLSPSIRKNAHYVVIYKMPFTELKAIGEELGDGYDTPENFANMVKDAHTKKEYSYVIIETRNKPSERYRQEMVHRIKL